MRRILTALSVLSLLVLAGCGSGGSAASSSSDTSGASASSSATASGGTSTAGSSSTSAAPAVVTGPIAGLTVSGDFGAEPTITVNGINATETQVDTLVQGDGAVVPAGTTALLNIFLANGTTGVRAASTWQQGAPSSVQLTQGTVFPELIDALTGTTVGSRVVLVAPVAQLWGAAGNTSLGLNPTDPAVWVIDVLSISPANPLTGPKGTSQKEPAGLPVPQDTDGAVTGLDFSGSPTDPPTDLKVVTLIKGTGDPVRKGTLITVNYFGEVWGGTAAFDESYTKTPVTFDVGDGNLIKAWDQGLIGVPGGSRVLIIAPPDFGYGSTANGSIPANSTLVFVVDVLGVG